MDPSSPAVKKLVAIYDWIRETYAFRKVHCSSMDRWDLSSLRPNMWYCTCCGRESRFREERCWPLAGDIIRDADAEEARLLRERAMDKSHPSRYHKTKR